MVCGDDPAAREIAATARCRLLTYGDGSDADWHPVNIEFRAGRAFFEPCYRGKSEGRLEAAVLGRHNVKKSLAVYALGRALGIERERLLEGFRTFAGVKRRQEIRGERRGILVIDDFAHHPTAVRETIDGDSRGLRRPQNLGGLRAPQQYQQAQPLRGGVRRRLGAGRPGCDRRRSFSPKR